MDHPGSPSTDPVGEPSGLPTVSVVICAYTEERWDDVLAAVRSVEAQRVAPHEIVLVVDHNRTLRDRLAEALPHVQVVENRGERGLSGGNDFSRRRRGRQHSLPTRP